MERRLSGELTRLDCEGQFKPFVYLNCRAGPPYLFAQIIWPKRKSPAFQRDIPVLSVQVRTNVRPCAADWDSDPDGSDLAAAVRASGRRPAAAGRASGSADPGSGSAGPDSDSGWTSVSPLLNVTPLLDATGNDNSKIRS